MPSKICGRDFQLALHLSTKMTVKKCNCRIFPSTSFKSMHDYKRTGAARSITRPEESSVADILVENDDWVEKTRPQPYFDIAFFFKF